MATAASLDEEEWERERGVAVNAAAVVPGEEALVVCELVLAEEQPGMGNSAGGAATATFTRASKAEVEFVLVAAAVVDEADDGVPELDGGWKAIIDLRDEVLLPVEDSPLCLE